MVTQLAGMSLPETERVTVATTTDLIEVIPMLLGFHPQESLVVIAVDGSQVVVTARADLPDAQGCLHASLAHLWGRFPRACFVFVGISGQVDAAWSALRQMDADLPADLQRRFLVADGRRWYDTPDDASGTPYDRVGSVHVARAAFAGRPVRASRDELVALLEPAWSASDMQASLVRVEASLTGIRHLRERAAATAAVHLAGGPDLSLDEATVVCLASHDPGFLDAQVRAVTRESAAQHQRFWLQVVRGSVPACAGGALVGLGISAWLAGEGALHTVCLEKLGSVQGPPEWVDLLDLINAAALSPDEWDSLREGHQALTRLG